MSDDEVIFSDDEEPIRVVLDDDKMFETSTTNDNLLRSYWSNANFAGDDEEPEARIIAFAGSSDDEEEDANEASAPGGVECDWEASPEVANAIRDIRRVLAPVEESALWRVVGMPNIRPAIEPMIPPVGFALGVGTMFPKAEILCSLIHPDKIGYGLSAIRVPLPEECNNDSQELYNLSIEKLKEILTELEFKEEDAMDFEGSFLGVYEEQHDFGQIFRRTIWVIVQDGNKKESMSLYDRIERPNSEGGIKKWQQLVEESGEIVETAIKKRESQLATFFEKVGLNFKTLQTLSEVIHQTGYSFRGSSDGIYYIYYSRCFPVVETDSVLIGDTPLRGFSLLRAPTTWSISRLKHHAFPYGTGTKMSESTPVSREIATRVVGNVERACSGTFTVRGAEFRALEENLGRQPLHPNSNLIPYVVKLHQIEKEESDCIWD